MFLASTNAVLLLLDGEIVLTDVGFGYLVKEVRVASTDCRQQQIRRWMRPRQNS